MSEPTNTTPAAADTNTNGGKKGRKKKGFLFYLGKVGWLIGFIGTVAGAIGIYPYLKDGMAAIKNRDAVELPDAFPNEVWHDAPVEKFAWLEGEWYYPSLRDFETRFKVENGKLYQQNEGVNYDHFITKWVETKVFISNKGVLRLRYVDSEWPGTFFHVQEGKRYEFYNNDRIVADDGTVTATEKKLVLNKNHCKVSEDGIYTCE